MRPLRLVVVLVVGAVLAAGCGDDDEPEAAATTTTSTTPTTPTTTAVETPTTPVGDTGETAVSELEDGQHFGFWASFEIGDTIAFGEFDRAEFLTGAEAEAAAAERGDEVNNDYYIVNDETDTVTVVASGDTEVVVLANQGGPDQVETNVADFAVERHEGSGFWLTIEDGIVTRIEEQFVP